VLHISSPLLVLAGAGSGKTRTIVHKVAWLLQVEGLLPWQVLAVTFTNKAAGEMRERLSAMVGASVTRDLWLGTFHSVCLRILRAHPERVGLSPGFVVYDDADQQEVLRRVLKDLNIGEKVGTARRFHGYIDAAKNEGQGPDHPALPQHSEFHAVAARVYAAYQKRLGQANATDFGDLLWLCVRLFSEHPDLLEQYSRRWGYVLVDEFQDTNTVQHRLLHLLTSERGQLCVVGDDDQSIYSWRGARVENILRFAEHYPGAHTVRLEQNYRSTPQILECATSVIANNRGRHEKTLWTEQSGGSAVQGYYASTDRDEAEWVVRQLRVCRQRAPLSEMAVLYRTNAMSRVLEDALRAANIAHRLVGGLRFYDRAEVKDVLAYLKLLVNPHDEVSFRRALGVPSRGIGEATIDKVLERARGQGASPIAALLEMANESGAVGKKLLPFAQLYRTLLDIAQHEPASTVASEVLDKSGYWTMLASDDSIEAAKRGENLRELLASIEEFQESRRGESATVAAFLDQVTLASSADEGAPPDAVTLMTVHAAKGLEFDVVFVVGLEEDSLPHFNSLDSGQALEEERRLCYVAFTRARRQLFLSWARQRRRFGGYQDCAPSRFLREIPKRLLAVEDPVEQRRQAIAQRGMTATPGASFHMPTAPVQARPPASTEVVVDRSYDQSGDDDSPGPGSRVRHNQFGVGVIRAIRGAGPDARVDVEFPGFGAKTIVARFLARAD
jgi:DNA helicase-2/ATP-dependent DNA helicase PcrA